MSAGRQDASENATDGGQAVFIPDDVAVDQLMSLGFSKNAALRVSI